MHGAKCNVAGEAYDQQQDAAAQKELAREVVAVAAALE
jgi:hypothetical protein